MSFALSKLAFKSIHTKNWPTYLHIPVEKPNPTRRLRSNSVEEIKIARSIHENTFHDHAQTVFNDLPAKCRNTESYYKFTCLTRRYLKDKALARLAE